MQKIGRFAKMAALQKHRALALGYPEDEAEAIGVAEATKYAIFKSQAGGKARERSQARPHRAPATDDERYAVFELKAREGRPYVGQRRYGPEDYQRALALRYGREVAERLEDWAARIIAEVPEETLKNERKFFREVWVVHRDDPV